MVTHELPDIPNSDFRQPKLISFCPQYITRSAFRFSVFICINISFILPFQSDSTNLGLVRLIFPNINDFKLALDPLQRSHRCRAHLLFRGSRNEHVEEAVRFQAEVLVISVLPLVLQDGSLPTLYPTQ